MSQFREPPPYPGLPKQGGGSSGLQKSFSGSEASTDVSVSSTKNLPSCHRQEPQGEETQVPQSCLPYDTFCGGEYSILARLGLPTSNMDIKTGNTPQIYVTGGSNTPGQHFTISPAQRVHSHGFNGKQNCYATSSESGFSSASTSSSKLTLPGDNSLDQNVSMPSGFSFDGSSPVTCMPSASNFSSPTSVYSYNSNTLYTNYPPISQNSAIDQSQFLFLPQFANFQPNEQFEKTVPMLPQYVSSLHPPPQYPGLHNTNLGEQREATRRSYEIIGKPDIPGSRSQPELSHFLESQNRQGGIMHCTVGSGSDKGSQHSLEQSWQEQTRLQEQTRFSEINQIAQQATHMVEVLTEENKSLRQKLVAQNHNVTKLQKFELEIQKVYEDYEALVKSSKKRELLDLTMKKRLEDDIKAVKAVNNGLIKQLQNAGIAVLDNLTLASADPVDSSMANVLAKHKEILSLKEHQDIELQVLRNTNQEQRAQIEILRNIQANQATRFDENTLRQQTMTEYDGQIQKELASIKAAYEKKELTENNIRQKLEKEVEYCRMNHSKLTTPISSKGNSKRELNMDMKRALDEKEAKILQLEKELIQWKEQQLEESIRKLKLQEMENEPLVRLPAYEQSTSSLSTETLINEAKTDKLKQMEENYQANRKIAELEASVKSLQSQVTEKDALLRVLQHSPMTRSSSVHTLYCTPHHSPRPSLIATAGSLGRQLGNNISPFLEVKHKKTGSASALEAYKQMSQENLLEKIQNLKCESKSNSPDLDDTKDAVWQV